MAGTKKGGEAAAKTNKGKYGEDYYARIGSQGGKASGTGGFASDVVGEDGLTGRERARIAGAMGGRKSKRGKGIIRTVNDCAWCGKKVHDELLIHQECEEQRKNSKGRFVWVKQLISN